MIRIKDVSKLFGIIIMSFCAVFVCTLFLNFNIDIAEIEDQITAPELLSLYDAQVMTGQVVSTVCGGCLLITSVIMLFFYIKHYIDVHSKELGILKALGYSSLRISSRFWVFGISVFFGTLAGFGCSFLLMPLFYDKQNENGLLPQIDINFHIELLILLVIVPTLFFALLAVFYSYFKLKLPAMRLLTSHSKTKVKVKKHKSKSNQDLSFIKELKRSTVGSSISLMFFIAFASFCYSAMTQMSFSMNDLASEMFAIMVMTIGVVLAFTTLFLAITTVVNSNTKTIAMMQVFGYSYNDCRNCILSGYRPLAYAGFVIGTIYQFVLLKITVSVIFKDVKNVTEYNFDIPAFIIALISFIVLYEAIMYVYSLRIRKISVKEIMLENL